MTTSRKVTRKVAKPVENHSGEAVQEAPSEEMLNEVDRVQNEVAGAIPGSPVPGSYETSAEDLAREKDSMQNQIKYQMAQLMKLAERTGTDLAELFPTPPKGTTVVEEASPVIDTPVPSVNRPKPGSTLGDGPNAGWVPWRREDLDRTDEVDFVPLPIPSLVFPLTDEDGRQVIKVDVNDIACWMTVGVPNTVNRFFYNAYMDAYNGWKSLENFKRRGPNGAPWGDRGPDGRPTWHYEPMALTFGLDPDGRYLTGGRQTMAEFEAELQNSEEGGAPL